MNVDGVDTIPATEAAAMLQDGATLVDVRESHEWAMGHAEGATHAPMSTFPPAIESLPEGTLLVICAVGGRSHAVAKFLLANGRDAKNVAGGMQAWAANGLPVERPA